MCCRGVVYRGEGGVAWGVWVTLRGEIQARGALGNEQCEHAFIYMPYLLPICTLCMYLESNRTLCRMYIFSYTWCAYLCSCVCIYMHTYIYGACICSCWASTYKMYHIFKITWMRTYTTDYSQKYCTTSYEYILYSLYKISKILLCLYFTDMYNWLIWQVRCKRSKIDVGVHYYQLP